VRRGAVAAFAAAVAAIAVSAASGDVGLSETATSTTASFSATLNGSDKTATYTIPLTVADLRGTGAGWNLTITSTQLAAGAYTLPTSASSVTAVSKSCSVSPCTNPTNSVTYPVTVPAGSGPPTAVRFYNAAAGTGKGTFTVTPTIKVAVGANAYKGSYSSTITLAIVSGP